MTLFLGKMWGAGISLPASLIATIERYQFEGKLKGGFQLHMEDTVDRLRDDGVLEVDDLYIGKTYRYMLYPPGGGWQNVCKGILAAYQEGRREPSD